MQLLAPIAALYILAAAVPVKHPAASIASRKLHAIESGTVRRGAVVFFSAAEVNALLEAKIPLYAPRGLRGAHIELGQGTAMGSAMVDFLKIRHAQGIETNWLVAKLIEGERPLRVSVHLTSAGGSATVFLDRVKLSGVDVSGATLEFLIQTFLLPLFPNVRIGRPFELPGGVDRLEAIPSGVKVTMMRDSKGR